MVGDVIGDELVVRSPPHRPTTGLLDHPPTLAPRQLTTAAADPCRQYTSPLAPRQLSTAATADPLPTVHLHWTRDSATTRSACERKR